MDPFGRVFLEFVVAATDDQRFDLWFEPNGEPLGSCPRYLALFGRMGRVHCAMEAFSTTPGSLEIRGCLRKQLNWQHSRELGARRDDEAVPPLFHLWVLSPGRPAGDFGRRQVRRAKGWPRGFYWTNEETQLWYVVVSELPATRETLFLRMLGSERVRRQAERELSRIPKDDPELAGLVDLIGLLLRTVERDKTIPAKDREDFMTAAMKEYQQYKESLRQEGVKQGVKQGVELGEARGEVKGAILAMCELLNIEISPAHREAMQQLSVPELTALRDRIKRDRVWPL